MTNGAVSTVRPDAKPNAPSTGPALLPLDRAGMATARLPRLTMTSPRYLKARLAYSLRAPWLTASRSLVGHLADAKIEDVNDTLFILGYWRSGTTYFHELASCNEARITPTTHQCFNPQTFPMHNPGTRHTARPMDNMQVSGSSPQEDEFALVSMGAPSPYALWLTPSRMEGHWRLGLEFGEMERRTWLAAFSAFACAVRRGSGKPLLLKSPPHSFRLRLLADSLPRARFIYLLRDPVEVFHSCVRMLSEMLRLYALEDWSTMAIEQYVTRTRRLLYELMEDRIALQREGRLVVVRFESLTESPATAVADAMSRLGESIDPDFLALVESIAKSRSTHQPAHRSQALNLPPATAACWQDILEGWRRGDPV